MLANTSLTGAAALAERLRQAIERLRPAPDISITASFGVAQAQGGDATGKALFALADRTLHQAKEAGARHNAHSTRLPWRHHCGCGVGGPQAGGLSRHRP